RHKKQKRDRPLPGQRLAVNQAQDEDCGQGVREEHDSENDGRIERAEEVLVRPDVCGAEHEVGQRAGRVRGLEPGSTAAESDEGDEPCVDHDAGEHRDAREVQRPTPSGWTRMIVTISEGRHPHRAFPALRSSAADRNPACRASSSVRSATYARRASSIRSRPNSGPVSYFARTVYPTPGSDMPSAGRTTRRARSLRRRSPSSTENANSPRGRPRGNSPESVSRAAQITRNVTTPPMIRRFANPIW